MTVVALVFGAALLLTWMVVHSYTRPGASLIRRRARPGHGGHRGDSGWMFSGSDTGGSDCGAAEAGGGCGDGGGGD